MTKFDKLEDLVNDDSFVRWIRGEANKEEERYWQNWLNSNSRNRILFNDANILLRELNANKRELPGTTTELHRLQQSVAEFEYQNLKRNSLRTDHLSVFSRIAAGLLLLIAVLATISYFMWTNNSQNYLSGTRGNHSVESLQTGYGEMATFHIGDGSTIILNAHTQLKVSLNPKNGANIHVWLKGEAYFNVSHLTGERQRLFIIHTKSGTITDLGTRFVVNSRSDTTQVILTEGSVKVIPREDSLHHKAGYTLKPGEMARFDRNSDRITIEPKVDTEVYTSWKDRKLVFNHTPMTQVVKRIEDTYGVRVVISDKEVRDKQLSGSLNNENLGILKEALSHALDVHIYQTGNTVWIGSIR